jgi:two-component system NtrC family response regulator
MKRVLIVDDDPTWCGVITLRAREQGCEAKSVHTLEDGIEELGRISYDLVFLDVNLPDGDGIEALPQIQECPSKPQVVIITGDGTADGAALAMKHGAWNYIEKGGAGKSADISLNIERALRYREHQRPKAVCLRLEGVIGKSPRFCECLDNVAEASRGDTSVLIYGETGTGKEKTASMIHLNSRRSKGPFIVVDCASLPDRLVESVLFGHLKGAFTGADKASEGLVRKADGGTLFLDEVGELPPSAQKSFLRLLQERRFRPVGAAHEVFVDFRLIAATNRDILAMVARREFREDLYYRLHGFTLTLPPLRQRKEDIPEIMRYHLGRICSKLEIGLKGTSPDFFEVAAAYDWPGNVRELVNAVESAVSKGYGEPMLFACHLPESVRTGAMRNTIRGGSSNSQSSLSEMPSMLPFRDFRTQALNLAERTYFSTLIRRTSGDIEKACRISGLEKSRIYLALKKHGISKPKSR